MCLNTAGFFQNRFRLFSFAIPDTLSRSWFSSLNRDQRFCILYILRVLLSPDERAKVCIKIARADDEALDMELVQWDDDATT